MTGQRNEDMILVPRTPTAKMLAAARDEAMAEDANAVWREMIKEFERSSIKNSEVALR